MALSGVRPLLQSGGGVNIFLKVSFGNPNETQLEAVQNHHAHPTVTEFLHSTPSKWGQPSDPAIEESLREAY